MNIEGLEVKLHSSWVFAAPHKDFGKDKFRLLTSCAVEQLGIIFAIGHHAVNLANTSYTSGGRRAVLWVC